MTNLYVVGGQQRALRPLLSNPKEWYEYQNGVILHVNTDTGDVQTCLRYTSRPQACATQDPEILFKSATLEDNVLYACTQTEVLLLAIPDFREITYISLPCFNDVHHVRPLRNGNLLVANSGLDMVLELTPVGAVVNTWNVLGEPPWERFSPDVDYRLGISTKPHRSHPNYVFTLGDEIWATRFQQMDAVSLTRPGRGIAVASERVHDGVLHDGHLYFTTVNGTVVIVNASTLAIDEVINLNAMHDEASLLGWCRGIHIAGDKVWIGFSRIRATKFRENVGWVVHGFKRVYPTHIACYDLAKRTCVGEIDVERFDLSAVFGIFPASEQPAVDAAKPMHMLER